MEHGLAWRTAESLAMWLAFAILSLLVSLALYQNRHLRKEKNPRTGFEPTVFLTQAP
jgi:hypothetical protein